MMIMHSSLASTTISFSDAREAYMDEVFTAVGLPIFVEGPKDPRDYNGWKINIHGLPRYISSQGGIFR